MLRSLWLVLGLAGCLGGQTAAELFEKAPPEVDEALRARIRFFFQCHVDGKFRQADQAVAEDSKDAFFAAEKTRYRGFEIVRIVYTDHFTRARAVVTVDTDFIAPGIGKMPVKVPLTTLWKFEEGQWWWYVDPNARKQSPFGPMSAGPEGGSAPFSLSSIPANPAQAAAMLNQVSADKTAVRLSSYEPASDQVTITNNLPGPVTLKLDYNGFPGFEARLEQEQLASKQSTRLLLRVEPRDKAPKPTTTLTLRVEPTNQQIPIQVTFAVPPEVEKNLPR
jgi:hypothetical protein